MIIKYMFFIFKFLKKYSFANIISTVLKLIYRPILLNRPTDLNILWVFYHTRAQPNLAFHIDRKLLKGLTSLQITWNLTIIAEEREVEREQVNLILVEIECLTYVYTFDSKEKLCRSYLVNW